MKAKNKQKLKSTGRTIGCLVLVALLIVISSYLGKDYKPDQTETAQKDAGSGYIAEARTFCQHFVTKRLFSPGSAEYPWASREVVQHLGDNRYRVRSYVDSQNPFGATIRTNYDCTVERTWEDWKLISLETR